MGRKYLWHKVYNYEVPYSPCVDVEGNPNLEWREESDPEPAAPQAEELAPVNAPPTGGSVASDAKPQGRTIEKKPASSKVGGKKG